MNTTTTRRGFTQIKRAGQAPGVRVDNSRATRLGTCNLLDAARGAVSVVGQALPDNAPAKGHLAAFTLIELLVVVLIIGILAAVAVPQYQKTIERSKATEAMSMLSSIAKAYQTYYLANGQYAEKFDELDVDIPFSGTTKFLGSTSATDTKSNKDWSFQIEDNAGYVTLYAARIDGKYKGAGFYAAFTTPTTTGAKRVGCFERKSGAEIFLDTNLPEGAYCERIMQATKTSDNDWGRYYRLP